MTVGSSYMVYDHCFSCKHKREGQTIWHSIPPSDSGTDILFKLGRKSSIYLFLLVIYATFTLIKEDKQFRFESTDVAELHVGKLVSQDWSQVSVHSRTKHLSCKIKFNCSSQLVHFTRDVLAVNLLLLCGDVLQNPGPTTVKCYKCIKTIRRNQGRATCAGCT